MEFDFSIDEHKKIGIFSDLHIGVDSDSKLRINESKKCVKWLIKKFKEVGVDWVIFCGDLFNSRYSINVNTLNVGIELVQDLSYNFEKVVLIEGNHDTYYKNSNSVNSISFLGNLACNDNILIVDEKPRFVKLGDLTYGFYPWGFTPDDVGKIPEFEVPDFGFGHFELNGIELVGQVSTGSKFNLSDMFALGNELFSGHYHRNGVYKDTQSGKVLHMVGAPLQLNWGDCNQDRKIGVLDGMKWQEIVNDVNAKFEKTFYSKFKNKTYTVDALKKICQKNFVKFVIDMPYQFEEILKCNEVIKKLNPYSLEFDYLISATGKLEDESQIELDTCKSKTNETYLIEYLEEVFDEYKKQDDSYDLAYLKDLALTYFNKALLPKEEREEKDLDFDEEDVEE